ncbi:pif-6 [Fopius arisanus]|nr:pif-6 [Fopius arisanus]
MRLTPEEFKKIRTLHWTVREVGDKLYNTTSNETDTALFWFDFMRNIFAVKFAQQSGVQLITDFDQTQPVLLSDDLQLHLPPQLETAMYYCHNKTLPFIFSINITHTNVFIMGMAILTIILIIDISAKPSLPPFI